MLAPGYAAAGSQDLLVVSRELRKRGIGSRAADDIPLLRGIHSSIPYES